MITGAVNPFREAIIHLEVQGLSGQSVEIEAVIDTGYDGYLTLPAHVISALGLPWHETTSAELADGSTVLFDVYRGIVVWNGQPRRIPIDEAETTPLVGMRLLYGHTLTIQVLDGGNVTIV